MFSVFVKVLQDKDRLKKAFVGTGAHLGFSVYSPLENSEILVLNFNFLSLKFYTNLDISLLFFSGDYSFITWYCQHSCSVSAVYNDCIAVLLVWLFMGMQAGHVGTRMYRP